MDDLKFITRYDLFPVIAGEVTLRALIERHYESAGNEQQLANLLKDMEGLEDDVEIVAEQDDEIATREQIDDAPVVKLINGLLTDAVRRGPATSTSSRSSTRSGSATASTGRWWK